MNERRGAAVYLLHCRPLAAIISRHQVTAACGGMILFDNIVADGVSAANRESCYREGPLRALYERLTLPRRECYFVRDADHNRTEAIAYASRYRRLSRGICG